MCKIKYKTEAQQRNTNDTKSWFSEISKINELLATLIRKKGTNYHYKESEGITIEHRYIKDNKGLA
jgi:hypothetical protein